MRAYVVDDDAVTRGILTNILASGGHEVVEFADGDEAWEAFERDPVPIVVTDWLMDRMSGLELCGRIRRHFDVEYTSVFLVTSLSGDQRATEAFAAGIDDMLSKPIDASLLLRRVASAERGQLAQLEHAMRNCLSICQSSLGGQHEGILAALNALASVTRRQGAYVRCRAFVRRELEIARDEFGAEDARTKRLVVELAELTRFEEGM